MGPHKVLALLPFLHPYVLITHLLIVEVYVEMDGAQGEITSENSRMRSIWGEVLCGGLILSGGGVDSGCREWVLPGE